MNFIKIIFKTKIMVLILDGRCRPLTRASFPALLADPERDGRNSTGFFYFCSEGEKISVG